MEFGQAVVRRKLNGKTPDVSYFGIIKDSQKDVVTSIEEQIYTAWDNSPEAPRKTRVRDSAPTPTLDTLSWVNGSARFPDALLSKFLDGSPQHAEMLKLKEQVKSMFPGAAETSSTAVTSRATGLPDFSGENLLDLDREVSLETTNANEFNPEQSLALGGWVFWCFLWCVQCTYSRQPVNYIVCSANQCGYRLSLFMFFFDRWNLRLISVWIVPP